MSKEKRDAQVNLKFTPEDRRELVRRAHERGLSVQEYAMLTMLDRPVKYRPGPPPRPAQGGQELP